MGTAQQASISFWELPTSRVEALLLHAPDKDTARYALLRQAFQEFHCFPQQMEEQSVGKRGGKNLICVLPGQEPNRILVAARYETGNAAFSNWPDAAILPMLYHALQAQPRQHTFVFAALAGNAGEKKFFSSFRSDHEPVPIAVVVLNNLGRGEPRFYTLPPVPKISGMMSSGDSDEKTSDTKKLRLDAEFTAHLQGVELQKSRAGSKDYETMLFRLSNSAAIFLDSAPGPSVSSAAFHRDFDFVAYFLCKIDLR